MTVRPDPPTRTKDRFIDFVAEWHGGCLLCDSAELVDGLPGCRADLGFPLCDRHLRWALASRRERVGRQARRLKHLLLAWCRLHDKDRAAALDWLGY